MTAKLYTNRRRAKDVVKALLDVGVQPEIRVHLKNVFIIVPETNPMIDGILALGKEVDGLPVLEECTEVYRGDAVRRFKG